MPYQGMMSKIKTAFVVLSVLVNFSLLLNINRQVNAIGERLINVQFDICSKNSIDLDLRILKANLRELIRCNAVSTEYRFQRLEKLEYILSHPEYAKILEDKCISDMAHVIGEERNSSEPL